MFGRVTLVLLISSKMRKSKHLRKFQTIINSTLWPSDIAANQRAPGQLQHIPFSLGITVVFSLSADVSQMACYGINCKVTLNWSVAFSYAHVLCARLYISWTTLITPHTYTERSILARCIAFILQSNCTMHYDNSKLTETRTNRGSGRNVELLPTIKKNSTNNKVWP